MKYRASLIGGRVQFERGPDGGMLLRCELLRFGELTMRAKLLSPARILIVDDHSMVREGLRLRISAFDDLEVCGEATSEEEGMQLVKETNPQLIIVDISLKSAMELN